MAKSKSNIALYNMYIEEQKIKYLKRNRFSSFFSVSWLGVEYWNIIFDESGDILDHV